MIRRHLLISSLALLAAPLAASTTGHGFRFKSIDGGDIALEQFSGQPVLVVNTASQCAYTPQYDALQALHERFAADGLIVLAVPSDDFGGQELSTEAEVKDFCEVNFNLTLPMTTIERVKGRRAHPFYLWAAEANVRPRWNFHKILLDGSGQIAASFGSAVKPDNPRLLSEIRALLP